MEARDFIGCFSCENLGRELDGEPTYVHMVHDPGAQARIAATHVLLDQHAVMHRYEGDRGAVISAIVAIAGVFRFAFDSDGFYGSHSAESGGTWKTGHHDRDR